MSNSRKRRPDTPMKKGSQLKRSCRPDLIPSDDSEESELSQPQFDHIPEEEMPKLPEALVQSFYKPPGVLLMAGLVSWDLVAKRENNPLKMTHPNLFTFHRFSDKRFRLIVSCCSAGHSVLVAEEGIAYAFGRNSFGQLGLADTETRNYPTKIPALEHHNIINAAVGKNHSLFVTDIGTVYACGDNKSGQCGVGSITPVITTPTRIHYSGAPIVKVACGAEFSMILDCNGVLHSFGLPEYGQLGHNTDGKYFVTATKLSYHYELVPKKINFFYEKSKEGHVTPIKDVAIVDLSCGNNHTVAIDTLKRAFSWGFGGFGRLGHNEQKDESVPRLITTHSRGINSVHCGSTYSLIVNEAGSLYMFGQTKRTGEANMYPKPVQDLIGWNIRSVGTSNTSIVIAADDSLIAWGVSPTYGELGLGEYGRSTTNPREVPLMQGLDITQVTMGFSHTLLLSNDEKADVKRKLTTLPIFMP
ncbi:protein RCC2 [Bicyclus anynana]|uniref:Protein RCC2 n=1 Tax=Bicyclus anynana TaxID=110368 RepID=A0ABM3M6C5_BICAN|nr:protein RCC2 [Bicyclus anynana]